MVVRARRVVREVEVEQHRVARRIGAGAAEHPVVGEVDLESIAVNSALDVSGQAPGWLARKIVDALRCRADVVGEPKNRS